MNETNDAGASVSLGVNTDAFDAGLKRAEERMRLAGDRMAALMEKANRSGDFGDVVREQKRFGELDRVREKAHRDEEKRQKERAERLNRIGSVLAGEQLFQASGRYDSAKGQLREAMEMGADGIGQKAGAGLGASLGQAAGAAFGGPFGMMVGNLLGGALGEMLGKWLGKEMGDAVQEDTWLRDIGVSRGRLTELFQVDWDKVWKSSPDELWLGMAEKARKAWAEVEEFGDKSLFRLTQGVDALWGVVQKPFAAIANWTQDIGQKIGLVEEGTGKWGDAILNVGGVGEKVVKGIAFGLGFLEGLFIKLGGVITKHMIAPLTTGLGAALQTASVAVRGLVSDPALRIGLASVGLDVDAVADKLGEAGNRLSQAGAGLAVAGQAAAVVDPFAVGQKWMADMDAKVQRGREAVVRDKPVPKDDPVMVKAEAAVVGSREDQRLRVQAQVTDSQLRALERLGRAADDAKGQRDTLIDLAKQLGRVFGGAQVIKPL